MADSAGLETALIDNKEAQRRWPLMDFSQVKAVLWCPSDGWMTPQCVAKAYEAQARKLGARVSTGTAVLGINVDNGRVESVETSRGTVKCRYVINAAGSHAYHVAKLA